MVEAWRALYQVVRPDMIVFDHCPTGLLAARGLPVKRVLIGTGFTCPPDDDLLPALRPVKSAGVDKLRADEQRILEVMNRVLEGVGQPPLSHIMQLYAQVDSTLLTTFRELDHYPHRPETAQYWGNWTQPESMAPQWPTGRGKRVYAYLKHTGALPGLLATLRQTQQPTIAYIDGLTDELRQQFNTDMLRLEDRPLNLQQVGQECDLAILNGGHGTSITMLLAGKPILQLPIYLEQTMLANKVAKLGMGLVIAPDQPAQLQEGLRKLAEMDQFTLAAQGFAACYADFDPAQQRERMLGHLAQVLASR